MQHNSLGTVVHNPPANAKDVRDASLSPGSVRSPGGGHGNPLYILAWRIPRIEEPGRLQSMGVAKVRQDWATLHIHTADNCKFIFLCVRACLRHLFSIGENISCGHRRYNLHIIKWLFHFACWHQQSSPHTHNGIPGWLALAASAF